MSDVVTRAMIDGGTRISWADYTFNPWRGCVKKSPACRFCYAERDTARWGGNFWGKNAPRVIASDSTWAKPRRWNRDAAEAGVPYRVFSGSLCDVFEDRDDLADARRRLFDLIESTEWLIWMLLTKRPEHIAKLAARYAGGWPPNVWLGVSAETQRFADERLPILAEQDARLLFVSAGPALGPVDARRWLGPGRHRIGWVITEGESGNKPGIRPSHPDWYRGWRDQAIDAGIPYQHKQNGVWVSSDQLAKIPDRYAAKDWYYHPKRHLLLAADGQRKPFGDLDGTEDPSLRWARMLRFPTTKATGRLLDGRLWDEFPAVAHA